MVEPRLEKRQWKPGLDFLRAVAVLLIVFAHAGSLGFRLPYNVQRFGWIGVDLFFVLSGYLIGGHLLKPIAHGRSIDLPNFYLRRAFRILPAYLAVLAIYAAFPEHREYPQLPPLWKFLTFTHNLGLHGKTAFSQVWSLSIEAQFYLVLPFFLTFELPRRHGGMIVAGIVLAGIILRGAIASAHLAPPPQNGVIWEALQSLIYFPTWGRLDPLAMGVGLAAMERFRANLFQRLKNHARWLVLPAFAAIAYSLRLGDAKAISVAACIWEFPLVAFGMSLLLICILSEKLPFHRWAIPGATPLAGISYSIYLTHKLAIHWTREFCNFHHLRQTSFAVIAMNLAIVALIGSLLFFAIERPFLRLGRKIGRKSDEPLPAT